MLNPGSDLINYQRPGLSIREEEVELVARYAELSRAKAAPTEIVRSVAASSGPFGSIAYNSVVYADAQSVFTL